MNKINVSEENQIENTYMGTKKQVIVVSNNEYGISCGNGTLAIDDISNTCGILLINNDNQMLMCIDETTNIEEAISILLRNADSDSIAFMVLGIKCDKTNPSLIQNMLSENDISTIKYHLKSDNEAILLDPNAFSIINKDGIVEQHYSLYNHVKIK